MAGLEQIELNRYHQELVQDVQHLVRKYCRIMSWEVPALLTRVPDRSLVS